MTTTDENGTYTFTEGVVNCPMGENVIQEVFVADDENGILHVDCDPQAQGTVRLVQGNAYMDFPASNDLAPCVIKFTNGYMSFKLRFMTRLIEFLGGLIMGNTSRIAELEARCTAQATRCEALEARCAALEARVSNIEEPEA